MRAIHRLGLGFGHSLRVAGLAAVFVGCTALQCVTQTTDIQYAAGYGYIVTVACNGCRYDHYYVAFDTYEEASNWRKNWQGGRCTFFHAMRRLFM